MATTGNGVEMSARGLRASLIFSVLVGALVVSCGGSGSPAASPEAVQEAGPGQATGGAPIAAPAPAVPPGRPGGAPPGAELVDLPGGDGVSLADWLDLADNACAAANLGPRCLNIHIDYSSAQGSPEDCTVENVSPEIGTKVTTRTPVTLRVSCNEPDPGTSEEQPTPGDEGTPPADEEIGRAHV